MSFDGIFIHCLLKEIQPFVTGFRINKLLCLDKKNFVLELSSGKHLLISPSADRSHIRFLKPDYLASNISFPFFNTLKKHLESGIITECYQVENDRIIIFTVIKHDFLGYENKVRLIAEMFGRNANLILTDDNFFVIDCLNKTYVLSERAKRIMVPKIKYGPPDKQGINPFLTDEVYENNIYQGTSNLAFSEISWRGDITFLRGPHEAVLIEQEHKTYFYCFDLGHISGTKTRFQDLSALLHTYFVKIRNIGIKNSEQKLVEAHLKKELSKARNKLKKQQTEYYTASENLLLKQTGDILAANLHKIKKNSASVRLFDFYNNTEVTVSLNPLLSPAANMEAIFNRYKKAKRTLGHLPEQMAATENEIEYLKTLENQIVFSQAADLKEIINELNLSKTKIRQQKKALKPAFIVFNDGAGHIIMVGKNNIQNNYITHKAAHKNDMFFHVKGAPGSHTILRGEADAETVKLAAVIAAYYSKCRFSENVAVDYTLVRYVRKIPKTKGSFVTYSNEKTIFVTPDADYIKARTNQTCI